jgi:hypothetical protein
VAKFASTFLLILAVLNVIATISLWATWLDAMNTSWAFRTFFADDVKPDVWSEVFLAIAGSFIPAGLAYLASARRWPRANLVHLLSGVWLLAYLSIRVPSLSVMFKQPFFDMSTGLGMWYRFHGFPAGTLALTILLLFAAGFGLLQERDTEREP